MYIYLVVVLIKILDFEPQSMYAIINSLVNKDKHVFKQQGVIIFGQVYQKLIFSHNFYGRIIKLLKNHETN